MIKQSHDIKNVIVLGGGTAGLVSALILKRSNPHLKIKVLESSELGIIGVGEGSTEHWKDFMEFCNLDIGEMFRETDATYKVGIRFENWNGDGKYYYHSVASPWDGVFVNQVPSSYTYGIVNGLDPVSVVPKNFDNSVFPPEGLPVNQFHFDTFKLNKWLHKKCIANMITFEDAIIKDVILDDESGYVRQLKADDGRTFDGDFFIDASGFNKVIIGKLGAKWHDQKKYLPMNHAIAFPTEGEENINGWTKSTAMSAGWMWKIPTYERYGNGYVFCDDYITKEQAVAEAEQALGKSIEIGRDIKFSAGYTDTPMVKNCVAMGLSGIFVEPLEASSIGATIQQSFCLSFMLHSYIEGSDVMQNRYNATMLDMFKNIVDYIQLHYMTKRDDSQFWKDKPFELTDFNKETIETFKKTLPNRYFFEKAYYMFRQHNWTLIMYGIDLLDRDSIRRMWMNQPEYARKDVDAGVSRLNYLSDNTVFVSHREALNGFRNQIKIR